MEKLQPKSAMKLGLALGVGILVLSGCAEAYTYGEPGVVQKHEYDDPDTWTTLTPIGKTWVPITHHDPAHWNLVIEQCGHDNLVSDDNSDGCGTFTQEVSEETYNQYHDGDTIVLKEH